MRHFTSSFVFVWIVLGLFTYCSSSVKRQNPGDEESEEVLEEIMEEEVAETPEEASASFYHEFIQWVAHNLKTDIDIPEKYMEYIGNTEHLMPINIYQGSKNGYPADAIIFKKKNLSSGDNFHLMLAYYEKEQLYDNQFLVVPDIKCFPDISFVSNSQVPVVEITQSSCAPNEALKTYLKIESNEWVYSFIDVEYMNLEDNLSLIEKVFLNSPALLSDQDTRKKALLYQRNPYARQLRMRGAYGVFNALDQKSGYLSFVPGFEEQVEYELNMSMTYWNLPDNKKLVGFTKVGCDMTCNLEDLKFYHTSDGIEFESVDQSQILPELEAASFLEEPEQDAECFYLNLLYELPQNGKDIRAYVEEDCPVPLKGIQVMLKWNGESFELGDFEKRSG